MIYYIVMFVNVVNVLMVGCGGNTGLETWRFRMINISIFIRSNTLRRSLIMCFMFMTFVVWSVFVESFVFSFFFFPHIATQIVQLPVKWYFRSWAVFPVHVDYRNDSQSTSIHPSLHFKQLLFYLLSKCFKSIKLIFCLSSADGCHS